jgi:hypothetical protein
MNKSIHMLGRWIDRIDQAINPHLPLLVEVEEAKVKGEYKYVSKPFKKDGSLTQRSSEYLSIHYNHHDNLSTIVGPYTRLVFRRVNLNSNMETKRYLLELGWQPKEWNVNDEGQRTSPKLSKDDPFDGIQGSLGRLVAKRVQCRHRKSSIEGWLTLIREDGRIPSIVNTIAATGRATHRNIVNIPGGDSFFAKWMRQCFISRDGWVLVGTDSDACQIRMLAGRMNDDEYTKAVLEGNKDDGTDIHSVNMRAAGLRTRSDAKPFFYGYLFGAGDTKLGKIVGGDAKEGKLLKEKLLRGLPALGTLITNLTEEWRGHAKKRLNKKWNKMEYYDGWVRGLDGRPIYIPSEHMVLVYVLQSDEAIMMQAAYCFFEKWMQDRGYEWYKDYGTVCWYHDEFTVECREEIAIEVAELAEKSIRVAGEFYNIPCPHAGNAQIGHDWWAIH